MDCSEAHITILDEARGKASSESRALLYEHIATCGDCAHELEAEKALSQLLETRLSRYSAPARLHQQVVSESESRRGIGRAARWRWISAVGALAAAMAMATVVLVAWPRL